MPRLGMDVDAVESIGHQMIAKSHAVTSVQVTAARLVQHAHSSWFGANGARWLSDWVANERAVRALASDLERMGHILLSQASEQRGASRPSGSLSTGTPGTHASSGRGRDLSQFEFGGHPRSGHKWSHERDLVDLAGATYGGSTPPGWVRVGPEELTRMGLNPEHFRNNGSGFHAELFMDEEGKYVLAFGGSDDWQDWRQNSGTLGVTEQDRLSIALSREVKSAIAGDSGAELEFTGHSLGGRDATIAAYATGDPATTFNSQGISDDARRLACAGQDHNTPHVTAFRTSDDPVSTFLPPPTGAETHNLHDPQARSLWLWDEPTNELEAHGLDSIRRAIGDQR